MKKHILGFLCMAVATAVCIGAFVVLNPTPVYKIDAHGTPVVMTINGDEIHANEYASYLLSTKSNLEQQMMMFGIMPDDLWADPGMLETLRESTKNMLTQYHVIIQKFQENNLKLDQTALDNIKSYRETTIEQSGGEENFQRLLEMQGLSEQLYNSSLTVAAYAQALSDFYFGKNGTMNPPEDQVNDYFNQNYLHAKHILITNTDPATGAKMTGEALAEKEARAREALEKAKSGENFDDLIREYGEDPGATAYPDGYVFKEGDMVPEFYEGAKALEENGISGLVESDYGYHIILRLPLDPVTLDENNMSGSATNRQDVQYAITGKDFNSLQQEWIAAAETRPVQEEIDKITLENAADVALTGVKRTDETSSAGTGTEGAGEGTDAREAATAQ